MNPPNGEVMLSIGRGRGPWRPDQNVIELRRPQNTSATSGSDSNSSIAEPSSSPIAVPHSSLSAEAKEFVPRFMQSTSSNDDQLDNSGLSASSAVNDVEEGSFEELWGTSSEEWFSEHLKDVVKNLTRNPGRFDAIMAQLLEELTPMLEIEEEVENILTIIMNQAISEPNFRYNGARLCQLLNSQHESGTQSAFRRILLNKLMAENDQIENNLEKNLDRVYGFVQFLGELYIQLELKKRKGRSFRIAILGEGLLAALKIFIQIPSPDNIKNTCTLLKLTGKLLDEDFMDDMNTFFADLQKLLGDERTGDRSKAMISNILKLRSENWGQPCNLESTSTSASSIKNKPNIPVWISDGVNYGPDGQAITAEEYKFLYENCDDTDSVSTGDDSTVWDPNVNEHENAEIMAAFREFVNRKP